MGGFGEGKGKEIDTYTENKNKEKKSTPLLKYVVVHTTLKFCGLLCVFWVLHMISQKLSVTCSYTVDLNQKATIIIQNLFIYLFNMQSF